MKITLKAVLFSALMLTVILAAAVCASASSSEALPDPVGIKFASTEEMTLNGCGYFTKTGEITSDNYSAVTLDGVKAIKLNYTPRDKWYPYVTMPKFRNANVVTEQHKYMRIVYMTTDTEAHQITLYPNAGGTKLTLVRNTAGSRGQWIVSDPVDLSLSENILSRYIAGYHNTLEYTSDSPDSEIYIKEIMFFCSLKQAGDYYGDTVSVYQALTFGNDGNSALLSGTNYGNCEINTAEETLDIRYAAKTNMGSYHFMAKPRFKASELLSDYKYCRILYSAEIPSGESGITMSLRNDGGSAKPEFSTEVADTGGEFVLTDTVLLNEEMMERLKKPMHASLLFDCTDTDAVFRIKAFYFFPEEELADEFVPDFGSSEITVGGVDITDFKIVVSENAPDQTVAAAELLSSRIMRLTGKRPEIVTDSQPPSAYEILVGRTNRAESEALYEELESYGDYSVETDGTKLVIGAYLPANLAKVIDSFSRNYLYLDITAPESIIIDDSCDFCGTTDNMVPFDMWQETENVSEPTKFKDTFTRDSGIWTEEENTSDWTVKNGVYTVDADGFALSYVHVLEKNVAFGASLMYTSADSDADMGLMLRYSGTDAFVKAGYDFFAGEWYIEDREGNDFDLIRRAALKAELDADTRYELEFTVDGTDAVLRVDNVEMLRTNVTQTSPGRIAVYCENASVSIDDADITLLSGEGTVLMNVTHIKIDHGSYMEGGSAWVLEDGTVLFEHSLAAYRSLDNGFTWERTDKRFGVSSYPTILRLNNGSLLSAGETSATAKIAKVSTDDGLTWQKISDITSRYWQLDGQETTAGAGNMNDKLFQSATTDRIFYCQNYESQSGAVEGRYVFCEFFYSDDNGVTWTKSETDSWEIEGNESETHFGECKILECDDGTLRMYNSWNKYGNIMYSESTDNGVTWGPLLPLEGFVCTQSSMQFVRDPYAENDTTYYMVWVNCKPIEGISASAPRSRLTLAMSTDGKSWDVLGDIWRWEGNYLAPNTKALINQIVDPFIQVTETTVIVGSGISEQIALVSASDNSYHQAQREHIWTVAKATLGADLPSPVTLGDSNGDGKVNAIDLARFQRYLAGWTGYDETTVDISGFDLNCDGKTNAMDAAVLARHIAGWIGYDTLPFVK